MLLVSCGLSTDEGLEEVRGKAQIAGLPSDCSLFGERLVSALPARQIHRYWTTYAKWPLFAKGAQDSSDWVPNDVMQSFEGNCRALAELMGITAAEPNYLATLVTPVRLNDTELDELAALMPYANKEREATRNGYCVTLPNRGSGWVPDNYMPELRYFVSHRLPTKFVVPGPNERETWPLILAKAIAYAQAERYQLQPTSDALVTMSPMDYLSPGAYPSSWRINATMRGKVDTYDRYIGCTAELKSLIKEFRAHPMVVVTPKGHPIKLASGATLHEDHAFAVVAITEDSITVRDPHGDSHAGQAMRADGYYAEYTLSYATAFSSFGTLAIGPMQAAWPAGATAEKWGNRSYFRRERSPACP
ncbi:MAG: hypothetical protein H6707_20840 [Deltaproteobacteria bacterium]|nr:hypothetical protein [Deltaproteobacteria bacterium]